MRRQLEGEMAELQSNITRLQKMETLLKRESEKADHVKELKLKMQVSGGGVDWAHFSVYL